jgi:hypothetical protein
VNLEVNAMTIDTKYELLAVDSSDTSHCDDDCSLLHTLRGYARFWIDPKVDEVAMCIRDGTRRLDVSKFALPNVGDGIDEEALFGPSFTVTLNGPFDEIEALREPLADCLRNHVKFDRVYVLKDEVSEQIAVELYPHLYRIENLLRQFLIKFMTTRIGPEWWDRTASPEMSEKVKLRKKNERVFGKHVENSVFLIDFGELGEFVYEQSSGFLTREEIIRRINEMPESAEAIHELKEELRSNYQKFFKESFADQNFKAKWQEFETLRNKIAHNNLFTADDRRNGEQLADDLARIISNADSQSSQVIITPAEHEQVISRGPGGKEISKQDFLKELETQEAYFHQKKGGFVGLRRFVTNYLVALGYDFRASYDICRELEDERQVEVYEVPNPYGENPTKAIRRLMDVTVAV